MKKELMKLFVSVLYIAMFSLPLASCDKEDDDGLDSTVQTGNEGNEEDSANGNNAYVDENPTGYINGYGYVDLGLPSGLKWATRNIGASSPSDYGAYYAWGETTTKSEYTSENSKTWRKDVGKDISGNHEYDAARAVWGGSWRLPTKEEWLELMSINTERDENHVVTKGRSWVIIDNHQYGMKLIGPNGNSIFLPAAHAKTVIDTEKVVGRYWSSTAYEGYKNQNGYMHQYAHYFVFNQFSYSGSVVNDFYNGWYVECNLYDFPRDLGLSIRPVSD